MTDPSQHTVELGHLQTRAQHALAEQDWQKLREIALEIGAAGGKLFLACDKLCGPAKQTAS